MMLRSGVFGATAVALPLAVVIYAGMCTITDISKKLDKYEKKEQNSRYATASILNTDVYAGDIITEDMLSSVVVSYVNDGTDVLSAGESFVGSMAKVNISSGTVMTEALVYRDVDTAGNIRTVELSNIYMPVLLSQNDFIDVRISFPDGEDYIVISKKRIYDLLGDEEEISGFTLRLSENDILRLQSAAVDMNRYKDTGMYAVRYTGDHQTAATEFYPVNSEVFSLIKWDPNIEAVSVIPDEQEKRNILEDNLCGFLVEEADDNDDKAADEVKEEHFESGFSEYELSDTAEIYG